MKIFIQKKKYLFLIFFFILLLPPIISSAALELNLEYPSFTVGGETFDLNTTQHLNQVVVWFYYFIIALAGFSAFVMLVWGGAEWLVSAGNPTRISSARERITSAITGLLIILVSFLILQTINPELTTLTFPETPPPSDWPSPPDNGTGPGTCPSDCIFIVTGQCPVGYGTKTSTEGGFCCCPSDPPPSGECPANCDFTTSLPCPPDKPNDEQTSDGGCCCCCP